MQQNVWRLTLVTLCALACGCFAAAVALVGTVYRYRLVAIAAHGTRIDGTVMTFATKATGRLLLTGSKLHVKGGLVSATIKCASTLPCKSRYTITTHAKLSSTKTVATVVCATTKPFFTIPAGKSATVSAPRREAATPRPRAASDCECLRHRVRPRPWRSPGGRGSAAGQAPATPNGAARCRS